jgi:hypothetical protein
MTSGGNTEACMSPEAGTTLIELMVSILILGLIVGPLSAAMIVVVRSTSQTAQRGTAFHDRDLVRNYLPRDLTSAISSPVQAGVSGVSTFSPMLQAYDTQTALCAGPTPSYGLGQKLFSVTWGEYSGSESTTEPFGFPFDTYETDYYTQSLPAGGLQLRRAYCQKSSDGSPVVLVSDLALSDGILSPQQLGLSLPQEPCSASVPYNSACRVWATIGSSPTGPTLTLMDGISNPGAGPAVALPGQSAILATIPDSTGGNATYSAGGTYSIESTRRST